MELTAQQINESIVASTSLKRGEISDGYHTFDELYEHRIRNFMALCWMCSQPLIPEERKPWITDTHSDGSKWDGWFIMGIFKEPGKQITYHLPMDKWGECEIFCDVLASAPKFDGHTSEDVLERIKKYFS